MQRVRVPAKRMEVCAESACVTKEYGGMCEKNGSWTRSNLLSPGKTMSKCVVR